VLIHSLGVRGALAVTGAFLPVVTLAAWRPLRDVDPGAAVSVELLDLLRRVQIFADLPQATLERVATHVAHESFDADATIFRQGDTGDRFYVVEDGRVAIDVDGRRVGVFDSGTSFGEIGLLRSIPRTASAVALTHTRLAAIEGEAFVAAVTGHGPSEQAAERLVAARLRFRAPGGAVA